MYRQAFKHFRSAFRSKFSFGFKKLWGQNKLVSFALASFAAYHSKKYFMIDQSQSKTLRQHIKEAYQAQQQMKKIIQVQVCNSQQIKQSQIFPVKVKNKDGSDFTILIIRYGGKLYAVGGQCTHHDLLNQNQKPATFQNAICFNDKLLCPHHGCAFDIQTGSVQYGPATLNLPIFSANQRSGRVKLNYPQKIPKGVNPKTVPRDYGDSRKVVILGQDHNATAGCIDGLRQYGFDGQISLILQNNTLPFKKDLLHKSIINLKLKEKYKKFPDNIEKQIQNILQQKIYSKLNFHDQKWYQEHGIQFVYNLEPYRIIHKRFYPYITFFDGVKRQYDGLVIATDVLPFTHKLNGITANKDGQPYLLDNVFLPFRNKAQHLKMLKFLNTNQIKKMIVIGVDQYSLQFLQAINKQFPDIKIQVLDTARQNKLYQIYGEQLTMKILQQYTKRNIQFYMKIETPLITQNKLQKQLEIQDIQFKHKKYNNKQIQNSIKINIGQGKDTVRLQSDCLVYFPSNYQGNTTHIKKKAKYTDLDFSQQNRIITEPNQKTDTYRIFSIGTVAQNQFFFSKSRLNTFNPNVLYQQGMNSAFNLLALNIPFTYIPVEITEHFGKRLYHAGSQNYINQMYVMGSIQNWDFLIFYAKNDKIYSVVASQSRQKQFQVVRQAFRLQCQPQFQSLVNNQWDIQRIYKLIKKINKSFCYRDQIHKIQDNPIKSNIIWIQRGKGAGFGNDKPMQQDQSAFQIDQRGYIREV